jgi:hypothetical protein
MASNAPASWANTVQQPKNARSPQFLPFGLESGRLRGHTMELGCPSNTGALRVFTRVPTGRTSQACIQHFGRAIWHLWLGCFARADSAVSRAASDAHLAPSQATRRSPASPLATISAMHVRFWGQSMCVHVAAWVHRVALSGQEGRTAHDPGCAWATCLSWWCDCAGGY